jgi:hypothetical protein
MERSKYRQLTRLISESTLKVFEIKDGYAFQLDSDQISLIELATRTAFERRCCPFFDFGLEFSRRTVR